MVLTKERDPADPAVEQKPIAMDQRALLESIEQSSREAIVTKSLDGRILSWNPAAERIYGYTAEEMIGKIITTIIPRDRIPEYEDFNARLHRGEAIAPFETVRLRKDGTLVHILLSVSPVLSAAGELIAVSSISSDITQRKELELAHKISEERLMLAVDIAGVGVWEWCRETNQVVWSANFERIHKLPPGTISCNVESIFRNVFPEDRPAFLAILSKASSGAELRFEYRLANSPETWVAGYGRAIPNNPARVLGICMDATLRKQAEQALRNEAALRESESRFHEMAEAMPHMVWTMLPDGTITYANQHCLEYLGTKPGGNPFVETQRCVHPEDLRTAIRNLRQALRTNLAREYELRVCSKTMAYKWHLVRLTPICDRTGKTLRWIGSATDVDLQKRAAQTFETASTDLKHDIDERTRQLKESEASIENILYNVGHQFRAPLRAMDGFSHVIMEDYVNMPPSIQDAANRIVDAAIRMDLLINDMLAYGHAIRDPMPCRRVDTGIILDRTLGQLDSAIKQRNAHIEVRGPIPRVWANPETLQMLFRRLVQNALKFVPPEREPLVEIWAEHKECTVRLWICDNGIGISEEHIDRIFYPFETLHGQGDYIGTGMGLAICQKAVERMKGTIGVKSTLGQGSQFWMELPDDPTERLPFAFSPSDFNFLPPTDIIIVTGPDGRVRWVNDAFTKISGYTLEEMITRKPGEMLQGPKSDFSEIQKLRVAIRSGKTSSVALVNYRKNKEPYWIEIAMCPIRRNGNVTGFVSVEREISLPLLPHTRAELRRELCRVVKILIKAPLLP